MIAATVRILNNSSTFVAIGAAAQTLESLLLINGSPNFWIVLQVFFFTWSAYLFLRRSAKYRYNTYLLFIAIVGSLICLVQTGFDGWPIWLFGGLLVLIYNISDSTFASKWWALVPRQSTLIKPAAVGFAWALTTTALPAFLCNQLHETTTYLLIASNFLFITGLAICEDISDQTSDLGHIKTLPITIGLKASKVIAIVHFVLSAILFLSISKVQNGTLLAGYLIGMSLICAMVIWISPKRNTQMQALLIDGSITALAGIVILLLHFN